MCGGGLSKLFMRKFFETNIKVLAYNRPNKRRKQKHTHTLTKTQPKQHKSKAIKVERNNLIVFLMRVHVNCVIHTLR